MNSLEVDLKVVVLGPAGVGKTCLINRVCNETFIDSTLPTIGAGFFLYVIRRDETEIRVMLWDTAGEERFKSVTPSLLHGADAMILVYDVNRYDSFDALSGYLAMFLDTVSIAPAGVLPVIVLGNKTDLDLCQVTENSVRFWTEKQNIRHFRLVSAKTGEGLTDMLEEFIDYRYVMSVRTEPSLTLAIDSPQAAAYKEPYSC